MTEQEQIEEIEEVICNMKEWAAHYYDEYGYEHEAFANCIGIAKAIYNAGYRKIDEFAECRNCTAWSGTDCTRNPYTQGCLKEENNIKRQAVQEFAEKLKKIVFEQGNPYNVPYEEFSQANVLFMVIDELLKEYEK